MSSTKSTGSKPKSNTGGDTTGGTSPRIRTRGNSPASTSLSSTGKGGGSANTGGDISIKVEPVSDTKPTRRRTSRNNSDTAVNPSSLEALTITTNTSGTHPLDDTGGNVEIIVTND